MSFLSLLSGLLSYSCTLECKKHRVASLLLIILAGRGETHWVLNSIPFILRLWPHTIQCVRGNVGIAYKLLRRLRYSHSSLPHWDRAYLRLTSFIGRILSSSRLNKVRYDLISELGMPIFTLTQRLGRFDY